MKLRFPRNQRKKCKTCFDVAHIIITVTKKFEKPLEFNLEKQRYIKWTNRGNERDLGEGAPPTIPSVPRVLHVSHGEVVLEVDFNCIDFKNKLAVTNTFRSDNFLTKLTPDSWGKTEEKEARWLILERNVHFKVIPEKPIKAWLYLSFTRDARISAKTRVHRNKRTLKYNQNVFSLNFHLHLFVSACTDFVLPVIRFFYSVCLRLYPKRRKTVKLLKIITSGKIP